MQRSAKALLKSTWTCWNGSEGNQCQLRHTSPPACGWGAVASVVIYGGGLRKSVGRVDPHCVRDAWLWLTKWFSFSRLETRTKEFNICASTGVANPGAQWKWQWLEFLHSPPASIPRENGLSVSIHVETRKMVNYAWIGRSQGKLWWRLVGILTCKSIFKFGYRGERLIEPY